MLLGLCEIRHKKVKPCVAFAGHFANRELDTLRYVQLSNQSHNMVSLSFWQFVLSPCDLAGAPTVLSVL